MNNWFFWEMTLFYLQHPNAVLLKGFHTCGFWEVHWVGWISLWRNTIDIFFCYSTFRLNPQLKKMAVNLLVVVALLYRSCLSKIHFIPSQLNRPCPVVTACTFSICCHCASTIYYFCTSVWSQPRISCDANYELMFHTLLNHNADESDTDALSAKAELVALFLRLIAFRWNHMSRRVPTIDCMCCWIFFCTV